MQESQTDTQQTQQARKSRTVCVEDPALTMVEPDTVTPSQFFDKGLTDCSLVPEKRLMLAVLEDAIASFQRNTIQEQKTAEASDELDVDAWLDSDDLSWPFSFASICQALNMEPEYLRKGLSNWRDRAATQKSAGQVYRFPFRRVNGRRHSINAKRERKRIRHSA